MSQRTVYVIAATVTRFPLAQLAPDLGAALLGKPGGVFTAFQLSRRPSMHEDWATKGYEVVVMGFVIVSELSLPDISSGAGAYTNQPGIHGMNLELYEVPDDTAAAFWRETNGSMDEAAAACAKVAQMFPWANGEQPEAPVPYNAPRGDA